MPEGTGHQLAPSSHKPLGGGGVVSLTAHEGPCSINGGGVLQPIRVPNAPSVSPQPHYSPQYPISVTTNHQGPHYPISVTTATSGSP